MDIKHHELELKLVCVSPTETYAFILANSTSSFVGTKQYRSVSGFDLNTTMHYIDCMYVGNKPVACSQTDFIAVNAFQALCSDYSEMRYIPRVSR
jgi:hypothetical protein